METTPAGPAQIPPLSMTSSLIISSNTYPFHIEFLSDGHILKDFKEDSICVKPKFILPKCIRFSYAETLDHPPTHGLFCSSYGKEGIRKVREEG